MGKYDTQGSLGIVAVVRYKFEHDKTILINAQRVQSQNSSFLPPRFVLEYMVGIPRTNRWRW
jgi:hypothetical protein